ncbi:23S rRNA (adenine(2503)-C(2))-methyltransferase RlmN, partial [Acuticoccus sp. 2012]|nr:23S rRNA (adenine(2503)-C(2))-methyltransferase RlmN [Acuticoccus mangrovi]
MANLTLLRRRTQDAIAPEVRTAPERTEGEGQLVGASREELAGHLAAIGVPPGQIRMRVAQLWHWLYTRGVDDLAQMTNVAAPV